jgi:AcrR family transcriptional regulator
MNTTRSYRQTARAAAREETRRRILEAAHEALLRDWYDEVTLAAVAAEAGVSQQTVINHFGGKDELFGQVAEHFSQDLQARRFAPAAGDLAALVEALVDDYELTGDPTIRMLALEGRVEAVGPFMEAGRAGHRGWCEEKLGAREDVLPLAVAVTDVYTWKLLRRDQGLSRDETVRAVLRLVTAVLDDDRRS